MNLVNLTPHIIVLRNESGIDWTIPPSGMVARVSSTPGEPEMLSEVSVPVYGRDELGEVTGLPHSQYCECYDGGPAPGCLVCGETGIGALFIVSAMVGAAISEDCRADVVVPGTGPNDEAVRDGGGKIVAVTRLKRV